MEFSGERFDVIVVGAGIIGSCAAYESAKRSKRVLLLERFDFLHHLGSSHGESRTIRATYPESYYASMALESFRLWDSAESESGYRVLTRTAHLDLGPADDRSLRAAISNCGPNSIAAEFLDGRQVSERFRDTFRLPDGWIAVATAGGVIKATKAVAMFQALAARRGALLRDRVEVKGIERDEGGGGGIWISTAGGDRIWCRKCVLAVGSWTRDLVRSVGGRDLPIQPLHTSICYWRIKAGFEAAFEAGNGFPSFASYGEPYIYGTPSMEYPGLVKVAVHGGPPCEPDRREWESTGSGSMVGPVREWIERVLPGRVEGGGPVAVQACMYSMTPDEDYVVDFVGGKFGADVVVAGGFSGHGFKMGPVVGRILAEMALDGGAKGVDMRPFRIGRFDDDPKGNRKGFNEQVTSRL